MIPPKGATPQGTLNFQKKFPHIHADKFRVVQGLNISAMALGTYLGHFDEATDKAYEEALLDSLKRGINFFDTAVNYRCQKSERVIGNTLEKLFLQKKLNRNEVVVATKGGFIPFDGSPITNMESYIKQNWIDKGIAGWDDIAASCHCISPGYIQDQIQQSLKNLKLDTIDIYYLHNPETQLPIVGPEVFYDRLKKAFQVLEDNVAKGRIQYYGIATWNGFREPRQSPNALDLDKILEIARQIPDNHFKAIQLPVNLAMLEAQLVTNIISEANKHGITVMTSAPLLQGQLTKLPSNLVKKIPGTLTSAQIALQFVTSTPGITAAMVGMKQKSHVEENSKILELANWDQKILQTIYGLLEYP